MRVVMWRMAMLAAAGLLWVWLLVPAVLRARSATQWVRGVADQAEINWLLARTERAFMAKRLRRK